MRAEGNEGGSRESERKERREWKAKGDRTNMRSVIRGAHAWHASSAFKFVDLARLYN